VGVERHQWFHGLQAVYEAYKPTLACLQCCLVVLSHPLSKAILRLKARATKRYQIKRMDASALPTPSVPGSEPERSTVSAWV
jgi:hypothetical protein